MLSAIYSGRVEHCRYTPVEHAFTYRLFMLYLDLDELDRVFAGRWLWSTRRSALARFRRADHLGDPERPLADCVRDRVAADTGFRPEGPIRLLTHLRYFGYGFNPVSLYYCFGANECLEAVVAEVNNTPWGERCVYALRCNGSGRPGTVAHFHPQKRMHVSPFMPMSLRYDWHLLVPGERLGVHMGLRDGHERLFDARLDLERQPINGRTLAGALTRFPLMTTQVITGIYWQALKLWLKGVRVYDHPDKRRNLERA
ncbi:DUF1365 domain-containing protein [Marinihelvus fidelis]|uniref:DUF1365 domain-containing protein n=1 Tax=Marinihelvus fidelis TaxID=2613842 RepID=A0A5N0TJU8_9GAMM|nr:DUF1365 domain-containing protein [Marinihelvus fidelis]KAA9134196.1 DUF1365 domain-containing protein [Marinihelvus fidelis]